MVVGGDRKLSKMVAFGKSSSQHLTDTSRPAGELACGLAGWLDGWMASWQVGRPVTACLPASLPLCLPASLPPCLPAWLPAWLPASLPGRPPACLAACLALCLLYPQGLGLRRAIENCVLQTLVSSGHPGSSKEVVAELVAHSRY